MSFEYNFLAIDWGTTNRRIFVIEDGLAVNAVRDGLGVATVRNFAAEVEGIRARFGDRPMLMAGMVGSNIGWHEVPYVSTPAGIDDLIAGLVWVDAHTAIVPGVSKNRPADVMRGEEIQLLGAIAAGLAPCDATLLQPGTHCKWAEVVNGRIVDFTSTMTGEIFSLLRNHSLLAPQLLGEVQMGAAFLDGVMEGSKQDLAATLFGIRASRLMGQRLDEDAVSFASGLLIGSDVATRLERVRYDHIHILADPVLGSLYAAAIEAYGGTTCMIKSHVAFIAGILEIARQ